MSSARLGFSLPAVTEARRLGTLPHVKSGDLAHLGSYPGVRRNCRPWLLAWACSQHREAWLGDAVRFIQQAESAWDSPEKCEAFLGDADFKPLHATTAFQEWRRAIEQRRNFSRGR